MSVIVSEQSGMRLDSTVTTTMFGINILTADVDVWYKYSDSRRRGDQVYTRQNIYIQVLTETWSEQQKNTQ